VSSVLKETMIGIYQPVAQAGKTARRIGREEKNTVLNASPTRNKWLESLGG
jgi:hypothetical protein